MILYVSSHGGLEQKYVGSLNKLAMVHLLLNMLRSQQLFSLVHINSAWFTQVIYISNAFAVSIKATDQLAGIFLFTNLS